MNKRNSLATCLAGAIGLTIGIGEAAPVEAQAGHSTLDTYRPAPRARDGFTVSSGEVDRHLDYTAALHLDYANDPLVFETNSGDSGSESARIVNHQLVGHAFFSIGLFDRAQVFVGLPINLVQSGDSALPVGVVGADGPGLGDAWLGGRVRILGDADSRFGLAAQATLTLPTARLADSDEHYSGERTVGFDPVVLAHVNIGILRVSANLGARIRANTTYPGLERGDDLTYAIGAQVRLLDGQVSVHGELFGSTTFQNFFNRENTPFEGLAGAKWFHESGVYVGGALGTGFVRGFGSPDFRGVLSIGYAREADEAPVVTPEPEREPLPVDSDADGILDADDACPAQAEDVDSFEDANGCPDEDNDQDGVVDASDGAPLEPEDQDGFEDANGVPDLDNDQDGVVDTADRCPIVAGAALDEGCPPPDRDGDTVVDRVDNCPDEVGTVENRGCRVQQQVTIEGDILEITENVYFATNRSRIEARSFPLLDNVAAVIVAHPEILRVRIEGHTDTRGDAERNRRLSQGRADAVMQYLVAHGVPAERLEARGYGADRPVVANEASPEDHANNRRVEFHIEDVASAPTTP